MKKKKKKIANLPVSTHEKPRFFLRPSIDKSGEFWILNATHSLIRQDSPFCLNFIWCGLWSVLCIFFYFLLDYFS